MLATYTRNNIKGIFTGAVITALSNIIPVVPLLTVGQKVLVASNYNQLSG